jgi:peptidoglycan/LPS O-acetylase OafA/YrhL
LPKIPAPDTPNGLIFVLSAFLLTWQLCRAPLDPRTLSRYFVARTFRIYPLYLAALTWMVLVDHDLRNYESLETAWRHATLRDGMYVF